MRPRAFAFALLVVLTIGCTAVPAGPGQTGAQRAPASAAPKRITIGLLSDPPTLWDITGGRGIVPGIRMLQGLVSSGLTVKDESGLIRPQLAESVPSVENGLWIVQPDGQMQTTWRIREGARWHDGAAFTSEDLLFTIRVGEDRDLAVFRHPAYDLIDQVEAPDPRTITVHWKRPYIGADRMFNLASDGFAWPLPQHLLGASFAENKAGFLQHAYWNTEFLGNGPFKVRDWVAGSHALLDAFLDYPLWRPKLDQIEAKFIPDPGTLVANVLAGAVDLTTERSVSVEQGSTMREHWRDGGMLISLAGWTMMYPQLRAPTPAVLGDARFRRALVHAVDRQQLADTLMVGVVPVAHSIIAPDQAEHRFVEQSIATLEYDPRRATTMIEGLGYARGFDGVFWDPNGQRLSVEIRTTTNEANNKTMLAVADFFQQAGVAADSVLIPVPRLADAQYRATYPGLELVNQPHGPEGIENLLHSRVAPLPERNFQAAGSNKNRGQYVNPDYDSLMDRYLTTIPMTDRMSLLGQLVRQQTEGQLVIGLFYSADAIMVAKRLQHVPPRTAWNAHVWDLAG
jgi:peptide/nickel transport system substrate-binding protein